MLFLISYSISIILGVGFVLLHDLKHIINIGIQIWMYATPILYPVSLVPANVQWIMYINPVALLFSDMRNILIGNIVPSPSSLCISGAWTLLFLMLAATTVQLSRKNILEYAK